MIEVLHMLIHWLAVIALYAVAMLCGLIIMFLLASIVVAIAMLFSWASQTIDTLRWVEPKP